MKEVLVFLQVKLLYIPKNNEVLCFSPNSITSVYFLQGTDS